MIMLFHSENLMFFFHFVQFPALFVQILSSFCYVFFSRNCYLGVLGILVLFFMSSNFTFLFLPYLCILSSNLCLLLSQWMNFFLSKSYLEFFSSLSLVFSQYLAIIASRIICLSLFEHLNYTYFKLTDFGILSFVLPVNTGGVNTDYMTYNMMYILWIFTVS